MSSGITNPQFPMQASLISPLGQLRQYHQDRSMAKDMYRDQMSMQNLDYRRAQAAHADFVKEGPLRDLDRVERTANFANFAHFTDFIDIEVV